MSDIVCRLRDASGKYDEYGYHSEIELEAAKEIEQLRSSLRICLSEAKGWMDEARGCVPSDVIGYNGWDVEAERLLMR